MIVFEIAFVLVNLAVPYWLWTSKTPTQLPAMEREATNRAIFRVVSAAGGFPSCGVQSVTERILDLCEDSRAKWTEHETTAFERAGADVIFRCEVRRQEIRVQWRRSTREEPHDLECGSRDDAQLDFAPEFSFNNKGQLRAIAYAGGGGKTLRVALTTCRRKLAAAKSGRLPASPSGDDEVCRLFDPAEAWEPFRSR